MIIIADLTRANEGSEPWLINALKTYEFRTAATKVVLVIHERQRPRVPQVFEAMTLEDLLLPEQIASAIRERLLLPILAKPSEVIHLVSFHSRVLELPYNVDMVARGRIEALHWLKSPALRTESMPTGLQRGPAVSQWSDTAITTLVDLLSRAPEGLRQSGLRDALSGVSREFQKRVGGPPISHLISIAQQKGLIEVSPAGDVNPLIRLAPPKSIAKQSQIQGAPSGSDSSDRPGPLEISRIESSNAIPSDISIPAYPATDVRNPQGGNHANRETKGEAKVSINAAEPPSRTKQFYELFRRGDLGPFSSDRDHFYAEMDRLVQLKKYSANMIVKKVARNVIDMQSRRYPWAAAERFLFGLLHRQSVLLDRDGVERDPTEASSFSKPIERMKEGWKDLLEAELLHYLVEADGGVSVTEMETIGFVMYPGLQKDDSLEKVEKLFGILTEARRIATRDGRLVATSRPPAVASIIRSAAAEAPVDRLEIPESNRNGSAGVSADRP